MEAHSASAGLPARASSVAAQSGEFFPVLSAVGRAEQGGVLYPGIDGIWIGWRGFQMPDALEFPRMLLSIVELMCSEGFPGFCGSVVNKLIALAFGHASGAGLFARRCPWLYPGFAAVIRALNDLPKPTAGLRCIDTIRVCRRALEVVHLPAGEVGTAYLPLLTLAV